MSDVNIVPGVTPVAPPAVAPAAPAPAPVVPPAGQVYSPAGTGDAMFDVAVTSFAQAYKVSPEVFNSAIAPAIDSGDLGKLDHVQLVHKLGAEGAQAAVRIAQAAVDRRSATESAAAVVVHAAAGGKENWVTAVAAFNASQPDFVKQQMNALLTSGDKAQVEHAAKQIITSAQRAGVLAGVLPVAVGGDTSAAGRGLSALEHKEAQAKLRKEAGNNSLESGIWAVKWKQLQQSRILGRSQGL